MNIKKFLSIVLSLAMVPSSMIWARPSLSPQAHKVWKKVLKETRVSTKKPITFRKLYSKLRPYLSDEEKSEWFAALQPHFSRRLSRARARGNKLFINRKGESLVIEALSSEKLAYKINGVKFSYKSLAKDGGRSQLLKVYSSSPARAQALNLQLTKVGKMLPIEWLVKAPRKTQIRYQKALRSYFLAYEKMTKTNEKIAKYSSNTSSESNFSSALFKGDIWESLLSAFVCGERAYAVAANKNTFVGKTCIDSGWIAKYKKTPSGRITCDFKMGQEYKRYDEILGKRNISYYCQAGSVACNPAIFGTLDRGGALVAGDSGKPICVSSKPKNERLTSTQICNTKSNIEKYTTALSKKVKNDKKFVAKYNQQVKSYNSKLDSASEACSGNPANVVGDQKSACEVLAARKLGFRGATNAIVRAAVDAEALAASKKAKEDAVAKCRDNPEGPGCSKYMCEDANGADCVSLGASLTLAKCKADPEKLGCEKFICKKGNTNGCIPQGAPLTIAECRANLEKSGCDKYMCRDGNTANCIQGEDACAEYPDQIACRKVGSPTPGEVLTSGKMQADSDGSGGAGKWSNVKKHLSDNKNAYILGTVGLLALYFHMQNKGGGSSGGSSAAASPGIKIPIGPIGPPELPVLLPPTTPKEDREELGKENTGKRRTSPFNETNETQGVN